jgi:cyanophycinase-like exopeptidase
MNKNSLYCYIGGGKILEPDSKAVLDELVLRASKMKVSSAVVILASQTKKETWLNVGRELFERMGTRDVRYFDSFEEDAVSRWEDVKACQAVFVTGGKPDILLKRLKKIGLFEKVKKFLSQNNMFIIGTSAGALVFNETCFISEDEDYPKELFLEGFSLRSDFICEVHYEEGKYKNLINALKKNDVVAIEENSALFCTSDEKIAIGRVHFFKKTK